MVKPRGVLHFYHWSSIDEIFGDAFDLVRQAASSFDRDCEFLNGVRVSKYSPGVSKIRIDAQIN